MDDVDQATTVRSGKSKPKPKLKPQAPENARISRGRLSRTTRRRYLTKLWWSDYVSGASSSAKRAASPAFIILHDKTLYAIAPPSL